MTYDVQKIGGTGFYDTDRVEGVVMDGDHNSSSTVRLGIAVIEIEAEIRSPRWIPVFEFGLQSFVGIAGIFFVMI